MAGVLRAPPARVEALDPSLAAFFQFSCACADIQPPARRVKGACSTIGRYRIVLQATWRSTRGPRSDHRLGRSPPLKPPQRTVPMGSRSPCSIRAAASAVTQVHTEAAASPAVWWRQPHTMPRGSEGMIRYVIQASRSAVPAPVLDTYDPTHPAWHRARAEHDDLGRHEAAPPRPLRQQPPDGVYRQCIARCRSRARTQNGNLTFKPCSITSAPAGTASVRQAVDEEMRSAGS